MTQIKNENLIEMNATSDMFYGICFSDASSFGTRSIKGEEMFFDFMNFHFQQEQKIQKIEFFDLLNQKDMI